MPELPAFDPDELFALVRVQGDVLEAFGKIEAPVADAVKSLSDAAAERLPVEIPALPLAPAVLVENQFAFARKVLDAQAELVLAILKAASPLLPVKKSAAKPAAK